MMARDASRISGLPHDGQGMLMWPRRCSSVGRYPPRSSGCGCHTLPSSAPNQAASVNSYSLGRVICARCYVLGINAVTGEDIHELGNLARAALSAALRKTERRLKATLRENAPLVREDVALQFELADPHRLVGRPGDHLADLGQGCLSLVLPFGERPTATNLTRSVRPLSSVASSVTGA